MEERMRCAKKIGMSPWQHLTDSKSRQGVFSDKLRLLKGNYYFLNMSSGETKDKQQNKQITIYAITV